MTRRLHLAPLAPGAVQLTGDPFHYLARVLRLERGAEVVLFDGAGQEARALITHVEREHLELEVDSPRPVTPREPRVILVLALLKGEKMDLVVQKATELGVSELRPIETGRAVVRLDDARAASRRERWLRIAAEAARQCGRADVPLIAPVESLAAALTSTAAPFRGFLSPGGGRLARPHAGEDAAVAVGPEGGFSAEEVQQAITAGWNPFTLGDRILRAETAAIAIVSGLRLFAAW